VSAFKSEPSKTGSIPAGFKNIILNQFEPTMITIFPSKAGSIPAGFQNIILNQFEPTMMTIFSFKAGSIPAGFKNIILTLSTRYTLSTQFTHFVTKTF
jgi:hypothetical protein